VHLAVQFADHLQQCPLVEQTRAGGTLRDWAGKDQIGLHGRVRAKHRRQPRCAQRFAAKLPDGRCPCPHWGYVIKGRLRVKYASHEEVLCAGQVYYLAPGHIPVVEEPLEIVEFSPSADYEKTTAALTA
jgi:hypothetical protein